MVAVCPMAGRVYGWGGAGARLARRVNYCLGANFARLELEESLCFFARKDIRFELDGRCL